MRGGLEQAAGSKLQAAWLREKGHRYSGLLEERAEWDRRYAELLKQLRSMKRKER